jgi:hypothetical protein
MDLEPFGVQCFHNLDLQCLRVTLYSCCPRLWQTLHAKTPFGYD